MGQTNKGMLCSALTDQVKPGTRILYYCIVKLLLCARETQDRCYGLTDYACKAVVFEACTIECHAFRRHP